MRGAGSSLGSHSERAGDQTGYEACEGSEHGLLTGFGGQYWIRTSDLLGVNEALYH